tara:strand:+ start:817 stop:1386 length:570 start_codon:yes stop_codon:yes gene_type:complete
MKDTRRSMTASYILVFGCVMYGIRAYNGFQPIEWMGEQLGFAMLPRIIYGIIGIVGVVKVFTWDFWTPFISKGLSFPSVVSYDNSTQKMRSITTQVRVPPRSKVMYWAPSQDNNKAVGNPFGATPDFKNGKVTTADDSGLALLRVEVPSKYSKPYNYFKGGLLPTQLHYRYEKQKGGSWSAVLTKSLDV